MRGRHPIEIAAIVVWPVEDTARALYDVDELVRFVDIQTETAVRHVASIHPYDSRAEGALSLHQNAEEITSQLTAVVAAGQRIVEGAVGMVELALDRLEVDQDRASNEERR
jgi:hypothetical protein